MDNGQVLDKRSLAMEIYHDNETALVRLYLCQNLLIVVMDAMSMLCSNRS